MLLLLIDFIIMQQLRNLNKLLNTVTAIQIKLFPRILFTSRCISL